VARPPAASRSIPLRRTASPVDVVGLGADLIHVGRAAGLAAVGITTADVLHEARQSLHVRKGRELHSGMQFTYRNPERSTDPSRILPGARSLVVGAWSYRRDPPSPQTSPSSADRNDELGRNPRGQVARYARKDHYADLRTALGQVAQLAVERGWRATVVCDDNALVDRAAAHRAGIGFYGKNSLLLLPGLGSWFVLGAVVTDAPLQPARPDETMPHASGCGTCSHCMTACPTGALIEPGVLDAGRCLAWLVQAPGSMPEEFRRALGTRIYGCDECQQVCPINRLADRKVPAGPAAGDEVPTVDLIGLLGSSDEQLMAAHGRWYIAGRDPRYLRRNALVALGNSGDGRHPATEAALRHWIRSDDPMLAEHARWAATELERYDLVAGHR
jgi:epoxyqueuosine reductase